MKIIFLIAILICSLTVNSQISRPSGSWDLYDLDICYGTSNIELLTSLRAYTAKYYDRNWSKDSSFKLLYCSHHKFINDSVFVSKYTRHPSLFHKKHYAKTIAGSYPSACYKSGKSRLYLGPEIFYEDSLQKVNEDSIIRRTGKEINLNDTLIFSCELFIYKNKRLVEYWRTEGRPDNPWNWEAIKMESSGFSIRKFEYVSDNEYTTYHRRYNKYPDVKESWSKDIYYYDENGNLFKNVSLSQNYSYTIKNFFKNNLCNRIEFWENDRLDGYIVIEPEY